MKIRTALTIAGSDCSGGAGIQADIKTMTMNGVYAMRAITALTAQNTTGVRAIQESTPEFLEQQLVLLVVLICILVIIANFIQVAVTTIAKKQMQI